MSLFFVVFPMFSFFSGAHIPLNGAFHLQYVTPRSDEQKNIFKNKSPAVLYGGSVDGNNVEMFKEISEIDGFLIGGASKSSKKFIDIIKNYYR